MSNILINNGIPIDFRLNYDDNWDFCLSDWSDTSNCSVNQGLNTDCLISYIDINDPNCVWFDKIYSKSDFQWQDAVNNGVVSNFIGYTGVDNGIITYYKDRISNEQFYKLYTNSILSIQKGDLRFHLRKVNGNNMIYRYDNDIVEENGFVCSRLNGGFYQGYFKLFGEYYQVLPNKIDGSIYMEFVLKKDELPKHDGKLMTLNDRYPENKGIFFYIGTRAENKWFVKYNVTDNIEESCNQAIEGDYSPEYTDEGGLNSDYMMPYKAPTDGDGYFADGYLNDDYAKNKCADGQLYVNDGYYKQEMKIDPDQEMHTADGYDFSQPNIIETETDNKFIFFNHTKDGFTTKDWNKDNKVILSDVKIPNMENYFLLFNHTKNGYTIHNIDKLIDEKSKEYSILDDIFNNALAFRITDDGRIGYKYLVRDCSQEVKSYKVESEYSHPNVISEKEWHTIGASIQEVGADSMRICFYIDGKLTFISKVLPMLDLRPLNDLKDKQVSVPYNISLGGGTQGLADVIYLNYRELPQYRLPLEKEFAGTFIGYIKEFRLYNCQKDISDIRQNANLKKSFNV